MPAEFPKHVVVHVRPSFEGFPVRLRFAMAAKNSFSYLAFIDSRGLGPNGTDVLRHGFRKRSQHIDWFRYNSTSLIYESNSMGNAGPFIGANERS